jgi:Flp pilus assembly pilin Flp
MLIMWCSLLRVRVGPVKGGPRGRTGRGDRVAVSLNKEAGRGIKMELREGLLAKVRKCGKGQTMTEYSLIVLFVGLAAYGAYSGLGLGVKAVAGNLTNFLATVVAAL